MNILVIHKRISYPLRGTIDDHLFSFYRYHGGNSVFYLRLDRRSAAKKKDKIPAYLKKIKFDVVAFHYSFADARSGSDAYWKETIEEVEYFRNYGALKVLLVQDEYCFTNRLNDFINYYGINVLYTVAPESEWGKIYNKVDFNKVKMVKTLTGFIDAERAAANSKKYCNIKRTIDIGYRARKAPPWYGRHGFRKGEIADVFTNALKSSKLVADISTKPEDTMYGKKWDEFIFRCKYMLGVESGVSVLDADGSMFIKGNNYIKQHPNYTFEEVEALIFPNMEGSLNLFTVSPRNFECCAAKTCQVLVEGNYDGVLIPDVHYIPVKKDFSNVAEVIKKLENDNLREQIVNAAYHDIIASGRYTYKKFAQDFFDTCRQSIAGAPAKSKLYSRLAAVYSFNSDKLSFQAERWHMIKSKYFSKWFYIDLAKKLKQNNRIIGFFYMKLKNKSALE